MGAPRTGFAYLDAACDPDGSVLAFAHRGGAHHPELTGLENSRRAFAHAVELGYNYLETDVHVTADGDLIAFHDEVLDRVTDTSGRIATMSTTEVTQALIGGLEPVPLMGDLFDAFPAARFNIDIKAHGAVDPLMEMVEERSLHDRVLIGSFNQSRLRHFRKRAAGRVPTSAGPLEVAAFLTAPSARVARRLGAAEFQALQVPQRRGPLPIVNRSLLQRAHALGKHVHCWTIDAPGEMLSLIDAGIDGLMTDRTDLLKEVLSAHGRWREYT